MERKEVPLVKKALSINVKKLTISATVLAAYVLVMLLTQSVAFGQYQVRVATSLYALAAIHPFLIVPLALANLLSNTMMGGLGPIDMVGGFIVGLLTAGSAYYLRRFHLFLVGLPIFIIPSLLVPIWLSYLLGIPYLLLVVSVGIGQLLPAILGVLLVKYLEKPLNKYKD